MFPSSTSIRELALNLAKVVFILKHSVELPDDGRRRKHVGAIFMYILI